MARIFTSNQVTHPYVVKAVQSAKDNVANEGDIFMNKDSENNLFGIYKGKGGIVRTDLIENIMYGKIATADSIKKYLHDVIITFDSNNLVVGADYLINIEMQHPVGMSPDNTYIQQAVARAFTGNSKSDMYAKLAVNLAQNFIRLNTPLFEVHLITQASPTGSNINYGTNTVEITKTVLASINNDLSNLTTILSGTYTGIALRESNHEWILGLKQDTPLVYNVVTDMVENTGTNHTSLNNPWGIVSKFDGRAIPVGHEIADFEYFHMGERADQYRMSGWPDYIPTEYMVDPSKEYDVVSIHYAYVGSNEAVQKSEKDVTFLCLRSNSEVGLWRKAGSADIQAAHTDAGVAAATASFGTGIDTVAEAEADGWVWSNIGDVAADLIAKINTLRPDTL